MIVFPCVLHCDAEDCNSSQKAEAVYEGPVVSLGLLPIGSPTAPFSLRYDRASKLDWVVIGMGKMACSKPCSEAVQALEKKADAKIERKVKKAFPEVVEELKGKKDG